MSKMSQSVKKIGLVIAAIGSLASMSSNASPVFTSVESDGTVIETFKVETPLAVREDLIRAFEARSAFNEGDEYGVFIDQIINIGKKVWTIIKDNAPVVNLSYDYANAVPDGLANSKSLTGFSDLMTESWVMTAKNGFGVEVYKVQYTLVHQYGGSYNGKGKYLETVAVVPTKVDVAWGYTVNFSVKQVSATNLGTKENPVAGLTLETSFRSSTPIKDIQRKRIFLFRGDSSKVTINQ